MELLLALETPYFCNIQVGNITRSRKKRRRTHSNDFNLNGYTVDP